MCLIMDGMDTTMVSKLSQAVKRIEGLYVKIHLCGVLVHGKGLYLDVWIDSPHKHDNNQVVTSIMHVIDDVRTCRSGKLPHVLGIQVDNCGRKKKPVHVCILYCTCWIEVFYEVYLSFLLVGHTHDNIDQRFSIISGTLKR